MTRGPARSSSRPAPGRTPGSAGPSSLVALVRRPHLVRACPPLVALRAGRSRARRSFLTAPSCSSTWGCSTRLRYQAGFSGCPPFEATTAYRPSCSTRISAVLRSLPLVAPTEVMTMTGLPWSVLAFPPLLPSKVFGLLSGPRGRARRILSGQWHDRCNGAGAEAHSPALKRALVPADDPGHRCYPSALSAAARLRSDPDEVQPAPQLARPARGFRARARLDPGPDAARAAPRLAALVEDDVVLPGETTRPRGTTSRPPRRSWSVWASSSPARSRRS